MCNCRKKDRIYGKNKKSDHIVYSQLMTVVILSENL